MTLEAQMTRIKKEVGMDTFVPSPDISFCYLTESEHSLATADLAAYAASPNSLYMYEQEKKDMLTSINNPFSGSSSAGIAYSQMKDEFDLKPQYELSNLALSLSMCDQPSATTLNQIEKLWIKTEFLDSELSSDMSFPMEGSDGMSSGPTLAELNMDESMIDEVVNLVSADSLASIVSGNCDFRGDNSVSSACTMSNSVPKTVTDFTSLQIPSKTVKPRKAMPSFSENVSPLSISRSLTSSQPLKNEKMNICSNTNFEKRKPTTVMNLLGEKSRPVMLSEKLSFFNNKSTSFPKEERTTLHKLLLQRSAGTVRTLSLGSQDSPSAVPAGIKRSATIASVCDEGVEEKWKEIEKFIHECNEESMLPTQRKRSRHDSGNSVLTSNDDQLSDMDVFSDRDSDLDDDLSDEEGTLSQLSPLEETFGGGSKRKDKQSFWQYNVQSKGPKGTRLRLEIDSSDPYHLKNFEDPVFDPNNTQVAGIRHGGKARKGDGNDVRPNPRRLCQIGMQIKRLNRKINEVTSLGETTASARNQSRKEKNKLASRACRLKKKAQHEANKVKLYGLEREHRQLMDVMIHIRAELKKYVLEQGEATQKVSVVERLEELIKTHLKDMIAGNTTDFVNKVVAVYEKGDPTGGLDLRK